MLANIFTTSDTVITSSFEVIASAAGKVDAWIDFDQDGVWQEDEQIFNSVDVVAGSNVLGYQIPAVTAADALVIINALSDPVFSGADGTLVDHASVNDFSIKKFPDPTGEGKLTANDALIIINFLGELATPPPASEQIVTALSQDVVRANRHSETKSTPEQATPVGDVRQAIFTAAADEVLAGFTLRAISSGVHEVELEQADEDEMNLESTIALLSTERA